MQAVCTKIVACATVIEETLPHLPPGVDYGDSPFNEYDSLVEHQRGHSGRRVERFGPRREESPGFNTLIDKMQYGSQDSAPVVAFSSKAIS